MCPRVRQGVVLHTATVAMEAVEYEGRKGSVDKAECSSQKHTDGIKSPESREKRLERQQVESHDLRIGHREAPEQTKDVEDDRNEADERCMANEMCFRHSGRLWLVISE